MIKAYLDEKAKEEDDRLAIEKFLDDRAALEAEECKVLSENNLTHPGSYSGCGGNPDGFANPAGDGRCTSIGSDQCRNCGRGI